MNLLEKAGKIAVIANIRYQDPAAPPSDEEAEFDDPETVEAIRDALIFGGADALILNADRDLPKRLLEEKIGFVFNIAEGKHGRDREAAVPGLLSLLGIPYSGSDALALSVTLDKSLTKRLAASFGIRTAAETLALPEDFEKAADGSFLPNAGLLGKFHTLSFPVILKPNTEGSGKGITERCIAESEEELLPMLSDLMQRYREDILIETFLPGREFTVGLLGNGKSLHVFPPMEIVYRHPTQQQYCVYSYEIKKNYRQHVDYVCPAEIPEKAASEMTEAARRIFTMLGCRDLARVDFRMDVTGNPYFLEINPLPGLAPDYSDYPMAAEACGIGYEALIQAVAAAALRRIGGEEA